MKIYNQSTLVLSLVAAVVATPLQLRQQLDCTQRPLTCVDGVLVIAARGTGMNPNASAPDPNYEDIGALRNIANFVVTGVGQGSYCQALKYPAARPDYFTSVMNGIDAAQKVIMDYVDMCKSQPVAPRIVLLGYSQGAQVMSGALVGTNGQPTLPAPYKKYITAGTFFASASFVAGSEPIDDGSNATTSGKFAKTPAQQAYFNNTYGTRIRDYCQAGDYYCANGGDAEDPGMVIHHHEVGTYTNASETFLMKKLFP